ncbi:MAG: hypothetical protein ACXVCP_07570 [Bdellovibrio sp.]
MTLLLIPIVSCFLLNSAFAKDPKIINNPYQVVWDEMEGDVAGLTRFYLDINDDGIPDLFVTGTSLIGNAGAPFHVFLAEEKKFKDLGEVFLDQNAFQLLKTKHHKVHDIKVCSHLSASECVLRTYVFDGTKYNEKTNRTISGIKFKEEIPSPNSVKFEKSGKPLSWK